MELFRLKQLRLSSQTINQALPSPPPPHSPHHRQKIRLNPSFVFLIILNLCHKARGPGAVYLHPPRYLFGNNIMFSLKQVLSPRRVPACARVCVLPELRFTFPDGWMGIQSPFFKVVHKMYLLFFISYLSQGVICFHSEKWIQCEAWRVITQRNDNGGARRESGRYNGRLVTSKDPCCSECYRII